MDKIHFPVNNRIHIVLDVFRIRGYDRAVIMIVRIFKFIPLIGNGRVEDMPHSLVNQPLDMAMGQLGRVAFGLTRNGFDSELINLPR